MPAKLDGDPKNWLLIRKREDGEATSSSRAQVRADARDARGREEHAAQRRLGVRDQVGRLPDRLARGRRRGGAAHPQGPGLHRALRQRGQGAGEGAEDAGLRGGRRGLRARRGRPPELLGDAAEQAGNADRLLPLRPARSGRRAGDRSPALGAARAARAAARQAQPHRQVLGVVRRRAGAAGGCQGAQARGRRGQAPGVALPPGQALARLAQVQGALRAGVRDRRLHARKGPALRWVRLARARGLRERGARVRRQRRHRLRRRRDRAAAEATAAAGAQGPAVRAGPEAAARAQGRHRLGRAQARRRGVVRRMDARRPPARPCLHGPARGQEPGRGAARASRRAAWRRRSPR